MDEKTTSCEHSDQEDEPRKENEETIEPNLRAHRNILERKRKEKIKILTNELREQIPLDYLPSSKKVLSNNVILETTISFIKHLKKQNEMFTNNQGDQAQVIEIARLKAELAEVKRERDTFEKMVNSAAAVTPAIIAEATGRTPCTLSSISNSSTVTDTSAQAVSSTAAAKLPGKGWIITQSGQAYYVNENGVPIAQGLAPQVLTDAAIGMSRTASVPSSHTTSVTAPTLQPPVTTAGVLQPTTSNHQNSVISSSQPSSLCNGILTVANNGSAGQIPSAIILPTGQIISVLASNSNSNQPHNQVNGTLNTLASSTSTSVISTAPSHAELITSSSLPTSNVMLLGQPPVLSNIVMNTASLQNSPMMMDASASQFGRKIMPKPQRISTQPIMASAISIAPLPLPIHNPAVHNASLPPMEKPLEVQVTDPNKKKRGKKKKKQTDESADILAEATASLFSPGSDNSRKSLGEAKEPAKSEEMRNDVIQSQDVSAVESDELKNKKGSDTHRGKKTPKKRRKGAEMDENMKAEEFSIPTKKTKPIKNKAKKGTKGKLLETEQRKDNSEASSPSTCQQSTTENQAIEFDPTELDMMLDQVENSIQSEAPKLSTKSDNEQKQHQDNSSDYLVLEGNEDLGPVYSSMKEKKTEDLREETTLEKTTGQKGKIPSYISEDTYSIPDIAKTVSEPVDHRRQGSKSALSTSESLTSDIASVYTPAASSAVSHFQNMRPQESHVSHLPPSRSQASTPTPSLNNEEKALISVKVANKVDQTHSSVKVQKLPPSEPSIGEIQPSQGFTHPSSTRGEPYSSGKDSMQNQNSRSADTPKALTVPSSNAPGVRSDLTTKPAWSPARETEWRMSQPANTANNHHQYERSQEQATTRHQIALSSTASNSAYQYTQFNSGLSSLPNTSTSSSSAAEFPTRQASINYWSNNPSPYQPQVDKRMLPSPKQLTEADRQSHRQQTKALSHQPVEKDRKTGHSLENAPLSNHPNDGNLYSTRPNTATGMSKSHAFSTESLLNKSSEPAHNLQRKQTNSNTNYKQGASNNSMDLTRQLYDKDRNFMCSQNERVPYNVNLFSETGLPSQTLSAFKSQSHTNSPYQASLSHKLPFNFALGNAQVSPSNTLGNSMKTLHPSHSEQHQMPINVSTSSQDSNFSHAMLMERARTEHERMTSTRAQSKEQSILYRNMDDMTHHTTSGTRRNSVNNHPSQERQSSASKAKKQKAASPVVPTQAPPHNTAGEQPALPYQFPGSAYLPTAFQKPRNESAMPADFFNTHNFSKSVGQPFGLPFQSPGFPGLPPHSAQSFVHHTSPQLGSNHQFNFNNIFKDNPTDSFKFPGTTGPPNGLYSPRTSHLYSNPMSINNLIGGSNPNFDRVRAPSNPLPAFHGQSSSFAGFHSPFDFPLGDQQH